MNEENKEKEHKFEEGPQEEKEPDDEGIVKKTKGFFLLQSFWLRMYIRILLAVIVLGSICGIIMVLFHFLLELSAFAFSFLPFYVAPIFAGAFTLILVKFGKINVLGTGAAEFIQHIQSADAGERDLYRESGKERGAYIFGKTAATFWTFGSGMLCGLEGPGLIIGSNLGLLFFKSEKFELDIADSMFIGASACTAAILKAPISGNLFCAEIPYHNHIRYKALIISMISSVFSYIIYCLFYGFDPLINIDFPNLAPTNINYFLILPLLALFGIFAGIFVLLFMGILRGFTSKSEAFFRKREKTWIMPLLGSIGYGLLLLIIDRFIIEQYQGAFILADSGFLTFLLLQLCKLQCSWDFYLMLTGLFIIAILLSIGTKNSAGIIMPLMILGALLGAFFGMIFYPSDPELFALLGIAAVLGASINSPVTAIFLIIEITWMPTLFLPAGITIVLAYIFSGPSAIIPGQKMVTNPLRDYGTYSE